MKRPNPEFRLRLIRLSRYRTDARRRRKSAGQRSENDEYVPPGDEIKAPKVFDITRGNGKKVARFLKAVANTVLNHKMAVRLNFKDTENFHVPGTILLFAELDRIIALSDLPKPISIIDPTRRKPREVLKQIGLHNLSSDSCDIVPEREDVVYWKVTKGSSQSGDQYGSLVEAVTERANKGHVKQLEASGLWRGVNEAVANSIDHAYSHPRLDGFNGLQTTKWWMFSQIKDGFFGMAVCDLGCGYRKTINETLPEKFIALWESKFQRRNRDAVAIDTAMEYGRSGTHESHRGKGSRDALSILESHGNGEMLIISNTGWMRYEYRNGRETSKIDGQLGIDIGGTIVWWKLPLEEVANAYH